MSVRTEPRFTRDADLAVAVADDREAETLVRHLGARGYRIEAAIEQEVVASADAIEVLPKLTIGVATTGHLIALKVLARDDIQRPQDLVDLRALLQVASAGELTSAREALALITDRGYHRGLDLLAGLQVLIPATP